MSSSPLDNLDINVEAVLRTQIEEGKTWDDIVLFLAEKGVVTSRYSVRRWAQARGITKVAAWASPDARAKQLAQIEKASAGDDVEQMRARLEHAEAELKSADAAIRKLRQGANRDVALGMIVERAIEDHFTGATVALAPYVPAGDKRGTPQEFLALVSDLHYGEVVDPDLAMGLEYNPEIARRRMSYLRDKILRYADLRPYEIGTLHVAVLGDMTSGNNHEDLDTTNARGMVDQAMDVAEMLFGMAIDFHTRFPRVRFTVMTGNHGRIHKVPRHKARYENWDYVAGRVLQTMVRQSKLPVEVDVPRGSRQIIEVAGARIALMHGDGVKAQSFAGIPFYAMKSKHDAMQNLLRVLELPPVQQVAMGHFHEHIHWPGVVVVNGSIKGGDEYVQDTRLKHTPAMQILQEWHPRYGLTTTDYIDVDHVH